MIQRSIDLVKILSNNDSAFLFGARGTGKTVLAKSWLEKQPAGFMINLLDPGTYSRYLQNPGQLRSNIEGRISQSGVSSAPHLNIFSLTTV